MRNLQYNRHDSIEHCGAEIQCAAIQLAPSAHAVFWQESKRRSNQQAGETTTNCTENAGVHNTTDRCSKARNFVKTGQGRQPQTALRMQESTTRQANCEQSESEKRARATAGQQAKLEGGRNCDKCNNRSGAEAANNADTNAHGKDLPMLCSTAERERDKQVDARHENK